MPENTQGILGSEKAGYLTVLGYDAAVHTMNQLDTETTPYVLRRRVTTDTSGASYQTEAVMATVPRLRDPGSQGWASQAVEMGNAIIYAARSPSAWLDTQGAVPPGEVGQVYIVTNSPGVVAANAGHDYSSNVVVAGPPALLTKANGLAGAQQALRKPPAGVAAKAGFPLWPIGIVVAVLGGVALYNVSQGRKWDYVGI